MTHNLWQWFRPRLSLSHFFIFLYSGQTQKYIVIRWTVNTFVSVILSFSTVFARTTRRGLVSIKTTNALRAACLIETCSLSQRRSFIIQTREDVDRPTEENRTKCHLQFSVCVHMRSMYYFSFIILLTEKTRVHKKRKNKYLKKKKQVRKHREMKKKKSGDKRHDVNIPHQMESWRRHSSPQVRNLNKNVCIQLVDGFFLKKHYIFLF